MLLVQLVALSLRAQPTAGSIVTHGIAAVSSHAVIDAKQNVYSYSSGGACVGPAVGFGVPGVCASPTKIVKADATGAVVFTMTLAVPGTSVGGLTVDPAGEVYFVGNSQGPLPTSSNAALPAPSTGGPFAAKLSADGSAFLCLTYLPPALAGPAAVQLDSQGNAYIAGLDSNSQPFVIALNADGSAILHTTVLASVDSLGTVPSLAVDAAGNAVIGGGTGSALPTTAGVLQPRPAASQNAFLTKLDGTGNIVFSTYLGGTGGAYVGSIQIDSTGNIYVGGGTGTGFPATAGTLEPVAVVPLWSSGKVGFVAKIAADGSAITWATYVPSNGIANLALGSSGDVYLASGAGVGFPMTASAPQPCIGGDSNVLVARLDASGSLLDATYFGNDQMDGVFGLTVLGDGSVLVAAGLGNAGAQLAQIRFGQAGWTAAPCMSPAVVNAATFVSEMRVAPGEFVTLTGFGIGPATGVSYQPGRQGQAPLSLGGVTVFFNGIPAPLLYVQSQQVNAQIPFEVTGASISVALSYGADTFGPFSTASSIGMPGIFRLQPGVSTQAAAFNQDGSLNSQSNPAAPGSVISFYGTGFGPLSPACASGGLNPPVAVPLLNSGVELGINSPPTIEYIGGAPTLLCGIVQINMQVPAISGVGSGPFSYTIEPGFGVWDLVGSTIWVQ
jgi:uncharacterized protein (TIGR03437 family)